MSIRNSPKYGDRQILANGADPDQTAASILSGQGLHCCAMLPNHLLDTCSDKTILFKFENNYSNNLRNFPMFRSFTVSQGFCLDQT